jgi:hypothetical protein
MNAASIVVRLLALAGRSGRIASATRANARLKKILVAGIACFALACTSAQAQDMALNKPVSASSTEGNRTDLRPELANDGNSSSRWSSNYADNQWWQVDLGSVREINRVELNWETAYASGYRIRTRRSSGNAWSTAATVTTLSPGLKVHTFPVRNARYVRIVGDQRATPWGISLWDVRVFGATSSPPSDGDGDGVPDSTDQCPSQPGPASNGGCPSPGPAPVDCQTGVYLARYWSNQTLSGLPVLSQCEESIDNDFGTGSPPGLPADGFSARYEGRVNFDAAEYEFALTGDDGVRLWVDGNLLIDRWVNQGATTYRATRAMTAGIHNVRVDYYEASGQAVVRLAITKQSAPPPPSADRDGDGAPDLADACPDAPGPASNRGCPETPPPSGQVQLTQIDGGPNYFGQFANPLPIDPGYFPIASWCRPWHDQAQVNLYKDFGLNVGICLENPELTNEALLRQNGIKAIVQAGERTRFNDLGSETAGWNVGDEVDMTDNGENKCPSALDQMMAGVPNDNRMIHNNYGKGVGTWSERGFGQWTDAKAACYVNYPPLDIVSIDTYWFTDVNEGSLPQGRHGWGYGSDINRLRFLDGLDGKRKPVFAWTELGPAGYGERRTIRPDEVRSAVWHQIIAGARMIAYFDHNFGQSTEPGAEPTCHGSTIRGECYPSVRASAKAANQQIKQLAPVINSPFVTSGHSISGAPTRRMVKWYAAERKFYVFLGTEDGGNPTFSMPCVGNATATRLAPSDRPGEAKSIPVNGGQFSDSFADKNAVHIYRIDGGSTCGLTG